VVPAHRRLTILVLALAVVVAAAVAVTVRRGRDPGWVDDNRGTAAPVRLARNPLPVPEFTVRTLDGATVAPADLRGKAVVLNFWATWCGPCIAEIPAFNALQSKYGDDLVILGLSVDEVGADVVAAFAARQRIGYRLAMAPPAVQAQFGGIPGLPTSFILDREGRVVQKHVGLWEPAVYEREIRALLDLPIDTAVEYFEDQGEVSRANAPMVTTVADVGLEGLTAAQRAAALARLNADVCDCGCGLTLGRCRVDDPSCERSLPLSRAVVRQAAQGR
jgi:thiol-disulfide isomerase/thioredoxin